MSDPFRSELEAAHNRIEKLEADHAVAMAKLEKENARLRARLADAAPPSRNATGRAFGLIGLTTLALSLAAGILVARMSSRPQVQAPSPVVAFTLTPLELPASASDSKPLDRDQPSPTELARALSSVNADDCTPAGTPRTVAHVRIIFAPNGVVTSAKLDGAFAGTPVGACIEARFREAHVEPFSGAPRSVGKTFVIRSQD